MHVVVRKFIFIFQLFLFSLSVPGVLGLVVSLFTGQKVDVDALSLIKIILDFVINVLVLVGLYSYAFNASVMKKNVWMIVFIAAVFNVALSVYDVSIVAVSSDYFLLSIIYVWQIIVVSTLWLYIDDLKKKQKRGQT